MTIRAILLGYEKPVSVKLQDGCYYNSDTSTTLILWEHPITGQLKGVEESKCEEVREEFIGRLKGRVERLRQRTLEGAGDLLMEIFSERIGDLSPEERVWLELPADTRKGMNKSRLADHLLMTSAVAVAIAQEWLLRGGSKDRLSRELPEEEIIPLVRLSALCHDFGKHPYDRGHCDRGEQAVYEIFKGVLNEEAVERIALASRRHHVGGSYSKYGLEPQNLLEEIICHADSVASGADRPSEEMSEDQIKNYRPDASRRIRDFQKRNFEEVSPVSLILADADRVKSYVFESAKLPEVRGASLLLDELNRRKIEGILRDFELPAESIVYAGGGSALIVAPTSATEKLCNALQQLYLRETGWATVTSVAEASNLVELQCGFKPNTFWYQELAAKLEDGDLSPETKRVLENYFFEGKGEKEEEVKSFLKVKRFGELTRLLSYRLRGAKEGKTSYPLFEAAPYAKRCSSCEIRPARQPHIIPERERQGEYICSVCAKKFQWGASRRQRGKGRYAFVEDFINFAEGHPDEGAEYMKKIEELSKEHPDLNPREAIPTDLTSIAGTARGSARGYIGLIYADGNDIGRYLEEITTPAEYRLFAHELETAVKEAVYGSLAQITQPCKSRNEDGREEVIHPFEVVYIGGDDLFLIVPGDVALEVACKICGKFEERFKEGLGLTMSVGVLISQAHNPIYFTHRVAGGLLKSAKRLAKKREPAISAVDFLVITGDTSVGEGIEKYREQGYTGRFDRERLTTRPFELESLGKMIKDIQELKGLGFPKSQLYQLRDAAVHLGMPASDNFYRYQLAWAGDKVKYGMKQVFGECLWRKGAKPGEWETDIVDIVEAYDYVSV